MEESESKTKGCLFNELGFGLELNFFKIQSLCEYSLFNNPMIDLISFNLVIKFL